MITGKGQWNKPGLYVQMCQAQGTVGVELVQQVPFLAHGSHPVTSEVNEVCTSDLIGTFSTSQAWR